MPAVTPRATDYRCTSPPRFSSLLLAVSLPLQLSPSSVMHRSYSPSHAPTIPTSTLATPLDTPTPTMATHTPGHPPPLTISTGHMWMDGRRPFQGWSNCTLGTTSPSPAHTP
ncbi:hypothetical protein Pmani_031844 [Petrolisthes manimaculis]|uniref:Uncharacterized protein n=1 Tax=Petrolisthes manimaculis TaxID=1843537 RepID=A0AAE1NU87_9EUCA|nr:hypothetical protein Pmani_031844 [Petrolisthes manimaculis]